MTTISNRSRTGSPTPGSAGGWTRTGAHCSTCRRFPQNSWRTGLDRLLLGVTMSEQDQNWLGLALPLDDVGSSDVDLAGRLAELVDRVQAVLDSLAGEQPLTSGWMRCWPGCPA